MSNETYYNRRDAKVKHKLVLTHTPKGNKLDDDQELVIPLVFRNGRYEVDHSEAVIHILNLMIVASLDSDSSKQSVSFEDIRAWIDHVYANW